MLVILEKKLNIFFFSQKKNQQPENNAKEIQIKGREKHPEQN